MRSQISKILETKKADRDHNKALKKLQAQQQHQQMDSGGRFAAAHAMEAGAYMDEGTERGHFGGDSTAEAKQGSSGAPQEGEGRGANDPPLVAGSKEERDADDSSDDDERDEEEEEEEEEEYDDLDGDSGGEYGDYWEADGDAYGGGAGGGGGGGDFDDVDGGGDADDIYGEGGGSDASEGDSDDSDSDDSSLQPYDMADDTSDLSKFRRPVYLRECLDRLKPKKDDDGAAIEATMPVLAEVIVGGFEEDFPHVANELAASLLFLQNQCVEENGENGENGERGVERIVKKREEKIDEVKRGWMLKLCVKEKKKRPNTKERHALIHNSR